MILPSASPVSWLLALAAALAYAAPAAAASRLGAAASRNALLAAWVLHGALLVWGLWGEALDSGKVKVPAGALPPQLVDPKAGETAADWGLYLIDSDEAFELHKATEQRLTPELARVLAGDAKAARTWFARLGTCKVPD